MTATTQIRAGAIPGPWLVIADKTPDAPVVDRGSTAITRLYVGVNLGKARTFANKTPTIDSGAVRDGTRITQFGAWAGAFPVQAAIADKEPSLSDTKTLSDTYLIYMSLDPLSDDVTWLTTDTYRPLLALECPTGPVSVIARTDTYVPRLTLGPAAVVRSGTTPVYASDTYVTVLSLETASLLAGEFIEGSDTYIPVLALDSGTGPVITDLITGSDTYTPVLQFGFTVTPSTQLNVPVSDTYTVNLVLSGRASTVVTDVDQIIGSLRPTGVITGKWI